MVDTLAGSFLYTFSLVILIHLDTSDYIITLIFFSILMDIHICMYISTCFKIVVNFVIYQTLHVKIMICFPFFVYSFNLTIELLSI
jgi:hypothetical protein